MPTPAEIIACIRENVPLLREPSDEVISTRYLSQHSDEGKPIWGSSRESGGVFFAKREYIKRSEGIEYVRTMFDSGLLSEEDIEQIHEAHERDKGPNDQLFFVKAGEQSDAIVREPFSE